MSNDRNMKSESKPEGMEVGMPQFDNATASSSSFGDSFSDHGTRGYESDNEVMSDLRESSDLLPLRKKRVTSHWRKFVQPVMWRCRWVELQLRKFEYMAVMYDKKIEKHNQTKQLKYKNFELEGHCAKSMPYVHDSQRRKLMKRKVRKRREESDTELCMLQHNITTYLATCRSPAHGPTMDDDETNPGPSSPKSTCNELRVADELLTRDFKDGYSLEQILWKIEVSQSQVFKMKDRLNTIMTENAGRILSTKDLILKESNDPLHLPLVEPNNPTDTEGKSTVATFASQLMQLNSGHEVVKSEVAATQVTNLQDVKEPTEQPHVATNIRNTDGILIYNRRAKKAQKDSGSEKIHPTDKPHVPEEEKENNNTASVSVSEDSSQNEQPAPKIRSISRLTTLENTKKRVARPRRKKSSRLWSRRISG